MIAMDKFRALIGLPPVAWTFDGIPVVTNETLEFWARERNAGG